MSNGDDEFLTRIHAATQVFHIALAEIVKRMPKPDREAIVAKLDQIATGVAKVNQMVEDGILPEDVETGSRYMHLEIRRLLSHIAGSTTGVDG